MSTEVVRQAINETELRRQSEEIHKLFDNAFAAAAQSLANAARNKSIAVRNIQEALQPHIQEIEKSLQQQYEVVREIGVERGYGKKDYKKGKYWIFYQHNQDDDMINHIWVASRSPVGGVDFRASGGWGEIELLKGSSDFSSGTKDRRISIDVRSGIVSKIVRTRVLAGSLGTRPSYVLRDEIEIW